MNLSPYSYTILQYRHDVWTGEALNVGVLLYCEERRFLKLKVRTGRGRISQAYPDLDHGSLRTTLKSLERRFDRLLAEKGMLIEQSSAPEFARSVLRDDDSSLRWKSSGSGLSPEPAEALDALYGRFVARYDSDPARDARTDEMVFETVRKRLQLAELYHRFEKHTVRSEYGRVTFDHALPNGVWHCVQPLSFDSVDQERMLSKAAKWAGTLLSLSNCDKHMRPYFVTGAPRDPSLHGHYKKMIDLLRQSPLSPLVVDEKDAELVVEAIASAAGH